WGSAPTPTTAPTPTAAPTAGNAHRGAELSAAKRALLDRWRGGGRAGAMPGAASGAGPVGIARTGIARRSSTGPAPASYTQEALWFMAQIHPDNPFYNMSLPLRLTGQLDVVALRAAVSGLVARHEVLRTGLQAVRGRPRQVVAPAVETPLFCHPARREQDTADGAGPSATEIDDWIRARTHQPFDLTRPPLVRFDLLPLGPRDHVLTISMHHLVGDGLSMGVLAHDIGALYEAALRGEPARLAPLPIQFADFATWQRGAEQTAVIDADLAYWRRHLGGYPEALDLPADRPSPVMPTFRGESERFALPADVSAELHRVAHDRGATIYMLVLTAFKTMLHRYTGATDLLVGSATHGRERPETAELIGFFANTLVMRTDLAGDPTFDAALARVRATCLEALRHQSAPFESVVAAISPGRDLAVNPIFRVSLVQQRLPTDARMGELDVSLAGSRIGITQSDIVVHLWDNGGRVEGTVVGSRDLFAPATVRRLARHLETLLAGVAADPARPLSRLPLLPPAERSAALAAERSGPARAADQLVEQVLDALAESPEPMVTMRIGGLRVVDAAGGLAAAGVGGTVVAIPVDAAAEPDPAPTSDGLPAGAVRTGLRGRRLADGRLVLGRSRHGVVALGPHRPDLDLLAERIRTTASVEDCAVTLAVAADHTVLLTVHVVPAGRYDGAGVLAAVRSELAAALPGVPAPPGVVVPVSRIPRMTSGIVDLAALDQLPVVDRALLHRWERRLAAVPGVVDVAVAAADSRSSTAADRADGIDAVDGSDSNPDLAAPIRPLLTIRAFVAWSPDAADPGAADPGVTGEAAVGTPAPAEPSWQDLRVPDRFGRPTECEVRTVDTVPRHRDGQPDLARLAAASNPTAAATAGAPGRAATTGDASPAGPPASPLEREIAAIWCDVLGRTDVGTDEDFFDLGGHSLRAAEAIFRLSEQIGVPIPIAALFEAPTVAGLAAATESARTAAAAATGGAEGTEATIAAVLAGTERVDLSAESRLAPEITVADPAGADAARRADPREVLLTGSTGFLGAFLLAELLDRTAARVHCVVRAADPAAALDRVRDALARYGRWQDAFAERIVGVPGDLGRPLLGLDPATFDALAGHLDMIIHNGATVSMLTPYRQLRGPNVGGTHEVFRLAARGRGIPVHYVSTAGTALAAHGNPAVITEDLRVAPDRLVPGGYNLTKWVAEELAEQAHRRGIPVAVYRPGRVSGDSRTGATTTDDVLWSYLRAVVDTGAVPDDGALGELELGLVPVDYVAAALVELARSQPARGRTYHLTNPRPTPLGDMLARMRASGYAFAPVPEDEWNARLRRASAGSASVGTAAALEHIYGSGPDEPDVDTNSRFDDTNTRRGLAASSITRPPVACPPVDAALLDRYLRYAVASGFLPPAPPSTP
ncbi:thioester reductase domain-containing protein, partial [Frankia tisae]|uniref:thioester reductase domain-containing protein n=1 Tax=Frankia tisae TaxID=2950104 RepID=UPI0021C0F214